MSLNKNEDSLSGLFFAGSAYLIWGGLPLYMHALSHISPTEVVAHRIVWSMPIAWSIALIIGRVSDIRAVLSQPKMLLMGLVTAALITVNWLVYVYAISSDQAVQAALGYYINPLFSVLIGATILKERLSAFQKIAIVLAGVAVVILTLETGSLPLVALGITFSWGFYALFKKSMPIGPNQGFLFEVMMLFPFAIGFLFWQNSKGINHFAGSSFSDMVLLIGTGFITAIPLVLYANGAKRLKLSTIGIMQYVAPTMILLIALFIFKEEVSLTRFFALGLIWVGIGLYSWSMFKQMRKAPPL